MTGQNSDYTPEDLLRVLTEQARFLWGEQRVDAIRSSLEGAARQLHQIEQNLPDSKSEPGFYQ